jgi:hypothetical protein
MRGDKILGYNTISIRNVIDYFLFSFILITFFTA